MKLNYLSYFKVALAKFRACLSHILLPFAFYLLPSPRLSLLTSRQGGFTLVEVLVAMVLFSLIFLPLTGLMVAESKFQRKYEDKVLAMRIASSELEKLKGSYTELKNESHQIKMAGRTWDVTRTIEKDSSITITSQATLTPSFITVAITRENDTLKLAELKVMKETYK